MELLTAQLKNSTEWECLKPGYTKRCYEKAKNNPLLLVTKSILNKYK